jgi:uncharacterized membrane protein YbhN (UPF0104 family)
VLWRAALSLGILAGLAWWLPTARLLDAIGRVPGAVWVAVVAGFLVGHTVSASKWRLLLTASGHDVGALEALRAHAAGLFANLCLPSVVGGDLVRAGVVVRRGGGLARVAVASLADRLNDTFALVTVAGLAVLGLPSPPEVAATRILVGFAIALPGVALGGLALARWIPPHWLPGSLRPAALRIREAVGSLARHPASALGALALSLAVQGGFAGLNLALARAMGSEAPAAVWLMAWPLAKLAALAPVSLGGIGVRELALATILAPFGVPAAAAVAQSLGWEAVLIGSGLLAGALAFGLGVRWRLAADVGGAP